MSAAIKPPPPPQRVRYNDWRQLSVPPPEAFTPEFPVSVIVPYFAQPEELARMLAALECQTYPRELIEVVVVDDGSPEPLEPPRSTPLHAKVVRQEDRGFRLAAARNAGVRAAAHDVLVFLDADMMPEADWLVAHARWHHAVPDALTIGLHAHVPVNGVNPDMIRSHCGTLEDLLEGRMIDLHGCRRISRHMNQTDNMTTNADDHFRFATGGNLGVRREFFDLVGGYDETFTQRGGEDTEFGWRAYIRGGLLVPVREAFAWHQGSWQGIWDGNSAERARSRERRATKLAILIPHPYYRSTIPGQSHTIPRHVVTVRGGSVPARHLLRVVRRVLGGPENDLAVRLELPPDDPRRGWLERRLGSDPRMRVGPARPALEEFPSSPFHITLPARADLREDIVQRLREGLESAVTGRAALPDGSRVSITRAWALHRALRTSREASDFGAAVDIPPERLLDPEPARSSALRNPPSSVSASAAPSRSRARLREEWRRVRGPRTALRFAWWLQRAVIRRVVRRLRGSSPGVLHPAADGVPAHRPAIVYSHGVEIAARGTRSRAVFEASEYVMPCSADRNADLVVADTSAEATHLPAPAVVLSEAPPLLSTPAINPLQCNPIRWQHHHDGTVGALGPLDQLPANGNANRTVSRNDPAALQALHHLEDTAAFHRDPVARAGELVRLAAMGVVVHLADRDARLAPYLGAKLFGMMGRNAQDLSGNLRVAHSIRMRREALREHSLRSRARQLCAHAGIEPPPLPLVSVLLVTRRPRMLQHALAAVARQTYPRLELVLGLHGEGFADADRQIAGFPVPATVVRIDREQHLGAALDCAAAAATGTLLAKMDDDDAYGREHVWDLVLAQEFSQAEYVAKAVNYTYLVKSGLLVHRYREKSEGYGQCGADATALATRTASARVGGFPRPRVAAHRHLMDGIRNGGESPHTPSGRMIYQLHGAGFVLVRRECDHTWKMDEAWFIGRGDAISVGFDPERSCIEDMAASYFPPTVVAGPARQSIRSVLDRLD